MIAAGFRRNVRGMGAAIRLPMARRVLFPLTLAATALLACGDPEIAPPADSGAPVDTGSSDEDAGWDEDTALPDEDAGPPIPGDDCDAPLDFAALATVGPEGMLHVDGDNTGGHVDDSLCDLGISCVADVVYEWTPEADGDLIFWLERTSVTRFGFDIRTACGAAWTSIGRNYPCGDRCGWELEVVAGEPLYFVVAGQRTSGNPEGMGTFAVTLDFDPFVVDGEACDHEADRPRCTPDLVCQDEGGEAPVCGEARCGDGYIGFGWFDCDDGNTTSGDGCSDECTYDEQGPGAATCADAPELRLIPGRIVAPDLILYGTGAGTLAGGSDLGASCATAAGPEVVYRVNVPPGLAHLTVGGAGLDTISLVPASDGCAAIASVGLCAAGAALEIDDPAPGDYFVVGDRSGTGFADDRYSVEILAEL